MNVLITGANGMLAHNIIKLLLQKGIKVRATIRDDRKPCLQQHPNLELIEGDITDNAFIEKAVIGCTHIIHAAALTYQNKRNINLYRRVNVESTENLVKAAIKYGTTKFAFISSANTLGYGSNQNPGTETCEMKHPFTASEYAISKKEAEESILKYKAQIEIIIVNPTFIIGGDNIDSGSGQIMKMGLNRKIIFYPPGGKNFVHVKDVAYGTWKAMQNGTNGERYLLANVNLSYKDFFRKLLKQNNKKALLVPLPKFIMLFFGIAGDIYSMLGGTTQISLTNCKALCVKNFYSNCKAQKHLGIAFSPLALGISKNEFQQNPKITH
nr:NAD-dependent epimerase/dehydratase family protein [Bacteroidota bacterium]